ncbi:TetR/AcrR family transcriptional regulator [Rossellomorea aquimaris]|uniref:TetR/AcrR family transcriptional regulator n=1 Tax=Rossellomorea aquimaris TaxID=189382 RepID=UPI001CD32C39|nr:TetR/AcrR family transcriptional regulator [Rossellomorea aquimaris]MCA1056018.1 TetR/AcrR family transcriptional regulator [Rossellomorea aquimaris]
MKEKEKLIIQTSIKLFASKGFNATSVQEIVNECDISKGAFYLYFKSKEALLLAIMRYYFELIKEKVDIIEEEDLPPYEKFRKQLEFQLVEVWKHKEFIIMQIRENAMPFNEDIHALLHEMKVHTYQYYRRRLTAIYGKEIEPYFWDLSLIIQGILKSYLEVVMLDKVEMDFHYLSQFILKRLDDVVHGLLKSGDEPVLTPGKLEPLLKSMETASLNEGTLVAMIEEYLQETEDENIRISLEVIKEEIEKEETRSIVIKGMLVNLEGDPSLTSLAEKVREYYNI